MGCGSAKGLSLNRYKLRNASDKVLHLEESCFFLCLRGSAWFHIVEMCDDKDRD